MSKTTHIKTINLETLDFLAPDPAVMTIDAIAEGLAKTVRFRGQTKDLFYSVAQHSVVVSKMSPPEHKLQGLLHDAAEAFMGDCPAPLKRLVAPLWRPIEDELTRQIFRQFGVSDSISPQVHKVDAWAFELEWACLMERSPLTEQHYHASALGMFPLLDWPEAKELFLNRFYELTDRRRYFTLSAGDSHAT